MIFFKYFFFLLLVLYFESSVYNITDKLYKTGLNYYNAKMHPSLSKENEYIITYNLNEGSGGNNFNDGDIYHPRFIKVKYI